jgi:hypothetical protein
LWAICSEEIGLEMRRELKRPFGTYLVHFIWIVLTIYYSTTNTSDFGQWTLRLMATLGTISFLGLIVRRKYFEVIDNKLLINKDLFRTKVIDINNIEKIVIEPSPFSSSKIVLKDNTFIKYEDSQVNDKELKEFMKQFDIPVE